MADSWPVGDSAGGRHRDCGERRGGHGDLVAGVARWPRRLQRGPHDGRSGPAGRRGDRSGLGWGPGRRDVGCGSGRLATSFEFSTSTRPRNTGGLVSLRLASRQTWSSAPDQPPLGRCHQSVRAGRFREARSRRRGCRASRRCRRACRRRRPPARGGHTRSSSRRPRR